MKPIDLTDQRQLDAAEGWLGLGDSVSANNELNEITPELRDHPVVLLLRCKIYGEEKKWESMVPVAETLVRLLPDFQTAWIHRSFALHELKRTQEAYDLLLPALAKFPKLSIVPYNLSCYACQLGHREESIMWLRQAIALAGDNEDIRSQALEDVDLKPLWKTIKRM